MPIYIMQPSISGKGIYHNQALGLISISSNGTSWITIADKNLGITSDSAVVYQFGNNNSFIYGATVTRSTSSVSITSSQVPSKYSSKTLINSSNPYSGSYYTNLRGETTNTNVARKGPCSNGYHVPSNAEIQTLISTITSLGLTNVVSILNPLGTTMTGIVCRGDTGRAYSSIMRICSTYQKQYLLGSNSVGSYTTGRGYQVRPFSNTSVVPDSGWTVLHEL